LAAAGGVRHGLVPALVPVAVPGGRRVGRLPGLVGAARAGAPRGQAAGPQPRRGHRPARAGGGAGAVNPLLEHEIPAAAAWTLPLAAGRELRLTALGDGANCSTLVFAARDRLDRLNIPDTLKAQMSACIRPPMVLMSDRGTALAS